MLANIRIGAIVYYVADIGRAEAFYRDVLGLNVMRMGDDGSGSDWLTAPTNGVVDLIFFRNTEMKSGQSPTVVYNLPDGGIDGIVEGLAKKGRDDRHARQSRARRLVRRPRRS